MLLVFNDYIFSEFINLDNVEYATLNRNAISFCFNSGDSKHVAFDTAEDAKKAFNDIITNAGNRDVSVMKIKTTKE